MERVIEMERERDRDRRQGPQKDLCMAGPLLWTKETSGILEKQVRARSSGPSWQVLDYGPYVRDIMWCY